MSTTSPSDGGAGRLVEAFRENFGHSGSISTSAPRQYGDWVFPVIEDGVRTTLIVVPFPVTSPGPTASQLYLEELQVLAIVILAGIIWALPLVCINYKCCCRCCRSFVSRRMFSYFLLGLVVNVVLMAIVVARAPHISANSIFFAMVGIVEKVTQNLELVLTQLTALAGLFVAFLFRKRIIMLLGYDEQLIRADLRDVLTCFSMHRFRVIEVSLYRVEGLVPISFGSRSLFVRIVLGYNEAQHSRPHDTSTTSVLFKENVQLNYDPEDNGQKLSIVIKQQEVVGGAVAQMAPAAGAVMGGIINTFTPVGTGPGAAIGAVTGIGAANSLGKEVARVELSSAQINRIRKLSEGGRLGRETMARDSVVAWREDNFTKVDLVPQGSCWLRISDIEGV